MMNTNTVLRQAERTVSRIVDGETVIVQPGQGMVTITNETGSLVWDHLKGGCMVQDLVDKVCQEFDVAVEQAGCDVMGFLDELLSHQLIIPC